MKNIKIPHHCVCPLAMSWKTCNHTQMHKCNTWSHTHTHACACARTCARIYTDTHIWVMIVYSNQYNAITTSAREGAWKYYLQNVTPTCCCWKPTIITAFMHSVVSPSSNPIVLNHGLFPYSQQLNGDRPASTYSIKPEISFQSAFNGVLESNHWITCKPFPQASTNGNQGVWGRSGPSSKGSSWSRWAAQ